MKFPHCLIRTFNLTIVRTPIRNMFHFDEGLDFLANIRDCGGDGEGRPIALEVRNTINVERIEDRDLVRDFVRGFTDQVPGKN